MTIKSILKHSSQTPFLGGDDSSSKRQKTADKVPKKMGFIEKVAVKTFERTIPGETILIEKETEGVKGSYEYIIPARINPDTYIDSFQPLTLETSAAPLTSPKADTHSSLKPIDIKDLGAHGIYPLKVEAFTDKQYQPLKQALTALIKGVALSRKETPKQTLVRSKKAWLTVRRQLKILISDLSASTPWESLMQNLQIRTDFGALLSDPQLSLVYLKYAMLFSELASLKLFKNNVNLEEEPSLKWAQSYQSLQGFFQKCIRAPLQVHCQVQKGRYSNHSPTAETT